MILCVGERMHLPQKTDEVIKHTHMRWLTDTTRCILSYPAMSWGPTRTRLDKLLGRSPDKIINLLPPDNRCGSWDVELARECGQHFWTWLNGHRMLHDEDGETKRVTHLFLLGRRVISAMPVTLGQGFGDCVFPCEGRPPVPTMLLPHPSGRSRELNTPAKWDNMRTLVDEFLST